ncbi:malonyl-ACP O-methyltransferase BioC [Heliorestis convoluta]|uniref:Malonyl-[acyl-carrier protein] O-methyltransferase n=1 Tax=Heliorestis convoluta TaxID=356322 RepID=A0A5Q2MYM1_9FIRM|nr:malonyl-ACP O-methyltransferase BioC [Heliorestis convoluta]QGG46246.1 malonyl-ACP O-methyltransferase BioC [Heliorestis convoluta]
MIDKKVLRINFSRNAANYDNYANVQKKMAQDLLNFFLVKGDKGQEEDGPIISNKNIDILEVGCGTGYLTKRLCTLYPEAQITAVDIAPGMIDYAQKKLNHQNLDFLCGDIEEIGIPKKFDLIISNATFQWFNQPGETLAKLDSLLKHQGLLIFSTFGNKTFQELHHSYAKAKEILQLSTDASPGQNFFHREELLQLLHEKVTSKTPSPYHITTMEKEEIEYFASVRDFLKSIKKVGASNSNCNRLAHPTLLKEMIRIYEQTYHSSNKTQATYHCLYFKIEKREDLS